MSLPDLLRTSYRYPCGPSGARPKEDPLHELNQSRVVGACARDTDILPEGVPLVLMTTA